LSVGTKPVSGLAARYAHALLELAESKKKLDQVAEDFRGLRALVDESPELRRLLRNPLFGRDQQAKALSAVLDKAGVDPVTKNFCLVATRNNRLFALPEMMDAYLQELAKRRGEVTAEVTAARELSDQQKQALTDALKRSVGGKVHIETRVDPALIGGLVVRVGSRMIDNSLRSKLNRLQHAMKGAG
jgi:F-type H+-transporting ATPase subunit delta